METAAKPTTTKTPTTAPVFEKKEEASLVLLFEASVGFTTA